ncbi:SIR2 family protein [Microcella sp.]|uniref:SIR2 family protein n=1 Tax=Microcella sp. TaxID=1913979 RepID=UPI003F6F7869
MAKAFNREQRVYFLGAGFSKAFGLPLTSELLQCLESLSRTAQGKFLNGDAGRIDFTTRLEDILKSFYPDGAQLGYRPTVVDFFSSLSTYIDLEGSFNDSSFPGQNPKAFMRLLKLGITRVLIDRTRENYDKVRDSTLLDEMVKPGSLIVTSNWDLLIEVAAKARAIPLRRSLSSSREQRSREVTLLKLHGSIDWLLAGDRKRRGVEGDSEYRPLSTQTAGLDHSGTLPSEDDGIMRIPWDLTNAWRQIRARTLAPHIVTMATGKSDELGPLKSTWRDAYSALSMAKEIEVVGYSIPPDDTEIRTLLRAGIFRGREDPILFIRNPSPDVHDRARKYLLRDIRSDYSSVSV